MGAWDIGSFDNDDASDWLYELERTEDATLLTKAISEVTEIGDDFLEAPVCCEALAAAEMVAALRGHPLDELPDEAADWLEARSGLDVSELVAPALAAVQRIRTDSELKDLWDDSDDAVKWQATLGNLTKRLSAK